MGDGGATLSGGERQRLGLARIFLKDPRVLILDEATNALDSVAEEITRKLLRINAAHRSTTVITHRIQTVRDADQILVLERGRITHPGIH